MNQPVSTRTQRFAPLLLVLACAALAVAAWWQALDYPFISDDISYVVTNERLASLHFSELWRLLFEPYNIGYEFLPLRDLSYWIDISLFGQNPAPYRLHNILLYLLCLPLLYAVTLKLWRYFRPADSASAPWAAAAVTSLFALHPALVESVVWISGRKYILPDLFSLLALWFAVNVKGEQGFSSRHAALSLLAFVGVMFSKSSYVGVSAIIAVLWVSFWLDLPQPQRRRLLLLWPLALLALAALLLFNFIIRNNGFDTVPPYFGIEAVTRSLAILGGLAKISFSLEARHFFYPVFEDPWLPAMVALGVFTLAAAVWGGIAFLRKRLLAGFALLAFLLLCLPHLQLVPAKPPTLVADRYVALAIWPTILLIVALAWRLAPPLRILVLVAFALPWLYQTTEHTQEWHSFESLVATDLRAHPGYHMPAFYTIINAQMHHGRYSEATETANRITSPEIRDAMLRLIRADYVLRVTAVAEGSPQQAMPLLAGLGKTLEQHPAETQWNAPALFVWLKLKHSLADEWKYLSGIFPDNALVRYNAGAYLSRLGNYWEAEAYLRAVSASKSLPETLRGAAYLNLGIVYMKLDRHTDAETMLQASLAQPHPDKQAYCLLEKIYLQTMRSREATLAANSCPANATLDARAP